MTSEKIETLREWTNKEISMAPRLCYDGLFIYEAIIELINYVRKLERECPRCGYQGPMPEEKPL